MNRSQRTVVSAMLAMSLLAASCSGSQDSEPTPTTAADTNSEDSATADNAAPSTPEPQPVDRTIVVPEPDPTPIGLEPEVRMGTLSNGLTYYVRSNNSPGNQVSLQLVVKAGSLQQEEATSGIAHFTEHMLFNGTEAYPGLELDRVLQGFGLQIGPDLNAYTSYSETAYTLAIPTNSEKVVATGVQVLRQFASAATIDPQAVIDERGIVREEFRLRRESADGVIFESFVELYNADSSYEDRSPAGEEDDILATTSQDVRRFYDRWYRPDNMAVIAVGDMDVDTLEDMIIEQFDDLEARGDLAPLDEIVAGPITEAVVDVITHPDGPEPYISLDFSLPNWDQGTVGGEELVTIEEVVAAMLRNRLDDGAARGTIPVVRPFAGTFSFNRSRRFLAFNVVALENETATAEALLTELGTIELTGFSQAELDRAVAQSHAGLDQWLDSIGSRQDFEILDALTEHFLSGAEFDDPNSTYDRIDDVLDRLTPETVSNHYRYVMSLNAPLLLVVGSDAASLPTKEALVGAIEAAATAVEAATANLQPPTSGDATEAVVGNLMDAPEPAEIANRSNVRDLEAIRLEFANGTTVIFAPSAIVEGELFVTAQSQGGWSTLRAGDGPYASLAASAVAESGVGELDAVDLDRALAGSFVGVSPFIEETVEGFSGSAASDDAELLFQLIHLMVTQPRLDDGAWRQAVESGRSQIRTFETDPGSQAFAEIVDARYRSDPFQVLIPDLDRLENMTTDEALELYQARLSDVDDLVVAIVGEFDSDEIIDLAQRYIGTLPAGAADSWEDHAPDPPEGVVTRSVGAGTSDSGAGVTMLFSLATEVDDRTAAAVLVLQTAINSRLFESVREELGASYNGGRVFINDTDTPDAYLEALVTIDGDPDRVDEIHQRVLDELADLARNGLDQDEFERATSVVLGDLEFINNGELINQLLSHVLAAPSDRRTLIGRYQAATGLTRREVADLARQLFDIDQRIEVFRTPS